MEVIKTTLSLTVTFDSYFVIAVTACVIVWDPVDSTGGDTRVIVLTGEIINVHWPVARTVVRILVILST